MRKLVIESFVGHIRSWTIDDKGKILILDDYYRDPEITTIDGEQVKVHRVDRYFYSEDGRPHKSTSIFTSIGHLLKDFSSLSQYTIQSPPIDLKLDEQFDEDIQLLLLDFVRMRRENEWKSQKSVKNLLRDFIVCVIRSRPKNLLDFTLDFMKKIERDAIVLKLNQK